MELGTLYSITTAAGNPIPHTMLSKAFMLESSVLFKLKKYLNLNSALIKTHICHYF